MRVLIFGATGALGHKLCQVLAQDFEVWGTVRGAPQHLLGPFERTRLIGGIDVQEPDSAAAAVAEARPAVIVNCIGVIKQRPDAERALPSLNLNSVWPHRAELLARAASARLIHISTDCVFSGRRGAYTESDVPDCEDLYGRSKLLGETTAGSALTLRTSFIGRELRGRSALLEWFLGNRGGTVSGYRRAIFSGFTSEALSRIIAQVIADHRELSGLYHVAAAPINKHDLLSMIRDAFALPIEIVADDGVTIDRSLVAERFQRATGIKIPSWPGMIAALAADDSPYEQWREVNESRG